MVDIALLVMTDGRLACLDQAIQSLDDMVYGSITRRVLHDDSGDPDVHSLLRGRYPNYELVTTARRAGFGGAYRSAWRHMAAGAERLVFGTEDDFVFERPVSLAALAGVLDSRPYLTQLALRRQAWNELERNAGGVVEQSPGSYNEVSSQHLTWLEHRLYFTTNPSLYRTSLCAMGWPDVPASEGELTHFLLRNGTAGVRGDDVRFGLVGGLASGVWVRHIGNVREGVGY
jgi:hypothetical protein